MKNKNNFIKIAMMVFTVFTLQSCAQSTSNSEAEKIKNLAISSVNKTDAEWKKELSAEQYYVLREKGTEKPFTGELLLNKEIGIYKCAGCGNELFTDEMKFDSHCGWPSFDKEIAGGKITTKEDTTLGMKRVEINCAKCDGHLGHIFDDGPTETGKRYCVNSVSLSFEPASKTKKEIVKATSDTITLGGGCFWCIEAIYEKLDGVKSVVSGVSRRNGENSTLTI
ncbi:peptide-methionine (R)-S-oxide reductase MsrB [Empedobacter falsenii]